MSHSPPKKRGAQPDNTNALKHGVYSRYYTPEELLALDKDIAGSLKDELQILRLAIFDAAESVLKEPEDSLSFHDNVSALRTISVSVARLENIIQVRMSAFGDPDRREKQVESMLAMMEQSEIGTTGRGGVRDIVPVGEASRSTLSPRDSEGIPQGPPLGGESPQAEAASGRRRQVWRHESPQADIIPEGEAASGRRRQIWRHESPNTTASGSRTEAASMTEPEVAHCLSSGISDLAKVGVGLEHSPHPRLSKNKGGAPPGNSNAYKHGFYARVFTLSEKNLLLGDDADQLRHEETLLRILLRRTWHSMCLVRSSIPWQEYLFTVRSIGYAVFVIAKLQRARRRFFGDSTDLEKDIQLGLSEACADLGILDYFHAQVEK